MIDTDGPSTVYAGISYAVTLRATPWRGATGEPAAEQVMWSADCEITEGVGLTASGASPGEALTALQEVILTNTRRAPDPT